MRRRGYWDRRRVLHPVIYVAGRKVHLMDRHGHLVCGASRDLPGVNLLKVPGRITCAACAARAPRHAAQHAKRPVVIGVDMTPYYRQLGDEINRMCEEIVRVGAASTVRAKSPTEAVQKAVRALAAKERRIKWTHVPIFAKAG